MYSYFAIIDNDPVASTDKQNSKLIPELGDEAPLLVEMLRLPCLSIMFILDFFSIMNFP